MNKKTIIFVTAMVLVFAMVTGATLAYMTSLSGEVTNTFVSGGFATLMIEEIDDDGDANVGNSGGENTYTVIPGVNINKDPQVTFTFDGNKITNAYVFVKITYGSAWSYSSNSFSATVGASGDTLASALTTSINTTNWAVLSHNETNKEVVLVYKVDNATTKITTKSFTDKDILAMSNGKSITVSANLTETQCEWIKNNSGETLDLDFKAYAIQSENFDSAAAAWAQAKTLG